MICSQIESANMGDLNYRGVIPNVPGCQFEHLFFPKSGDSLIRLALGNPPVVTYISTYIHNYGGEGENSISAPFIRDHP